MAIIEGDRMVRKSQPTQSAVHVDRPLTNVSLAIFQDPSKFIAGEVFPTIPVSKQSDLYRTYPEEAFNRDQMRKRAAGTETAGIGYETSTTPYFCDVYGLHHDIDEQTEENADEEVDLDFEATTLLSYQALINREANWARDYFQSGSWSNETDISAGTQWAGGPSSTGDPIGDIEAARLAFMERTGNVPNVMLLGPEVWSQLKQHQDILDRVNRGQTQGVAEVLRDTLASITEIPRVLVAESIVNSAAEGAANSPGFIFGKHCLLMHVAERPGRYTPSAGYTFAWRGLSGASVAGTRISRFEMLKTRSRRVEIESSYDQHKVADTLATMLLNCVA